MLYHVSPVAGLTLLEPRVSTHGRAYVYALANPVTALLFGARQDDFDFIISTDAGGRPTICECYPGALAQKYGGVSCALYTVDEAGFRRGMTSWDAELVSESAVPVRSETPVPDLLRRLEAEEAAGTLEIVRYRDEPAYRRQVARHVTDRLIRFGVLDGAWTRDPRFAGVYRPLIEALLAAQG